MKVNVFEGGRRISRLLQWCWAIASALALWSNKPYVRFTFETSGPAASFVPVAECSTSEGAVDYRTYQLEGGKEIHLTLCYKAMGFSNNPMLVPYQIDPDGQIWGNDRFTPKVEEYTKARTASFVLSDSNRQVALKEYQKKDWEQDLRNLAIVGGGAFVIWLISSVIGWILRGFLQIPKGKDVRPVPTSPSPEPVPPATPH